MDSVVEFFLALIARVVLTVKDYTRFCVVATVAACGGVAVGALGAMLGVAMRHTLLFSGSLLFIGACALAWAAVISPVLLTGMELYRRVRVVQTFVRWCAVSGIGLVLFLLYVSRFSILNRPHLLLPLALATVLICSAMVAQGSGLRTTLAKAAGIGTVAFITVTSLLPANGCRSSTTHAAVAMRPAAPPTRLVMERPQELPATPQPQPTTKPAILLPAETELPVELLGAIYTDCAPTCFVPGALTKLAADGRAIFRDTPVRVHVEFTDTSLEHPAMLVSISTISLLRPGLFIDPNALQLTPSVAPIPMNFSRRERDSPTTNLDRMLERQGLPAVPDVLVPKHEIVRFHLADPLTVPVR